MEQLLRAAGRGTARQDARPAQAKAYDFVLIDSRTGVSDTSGICTIQLPDRLVACYTLNRQSIEGVDSALESICKQRDNIRPLKILPLEMRIDTSEKQKLDTVRAVARPRFRRYLGEDPDPSYWENMEIFYWPFYNFEECLAVFGDDPENRSSISMLSAMERVARCVSGIPDVRALPIDFQKRRSVLASYALGASHSEVEDSLADGPEIFSEVFLRYQEWTKSYASTALLTGRVLQQLDKAGPLPKSLRADSQFMMYLIRSRDRYAHVRRLVFTTLIATVGALAIAAFVISFLLADVNRVALLALAAVYSATALGAGVYFMTSSNKPSSLGS